MPLGDRRIELRRVEVLPGHNADLGELRDHRRVGGGRRIGLQQLGEQLEVGVARPAVDLIAHRGLHVDRRIDLARRAAYTACRRR